MTISIDQLRLEELRMLFVRASWTQGPDRSCAFVSIEMRRGQTIDVPLADLLELIAAKEAVIRNPYQDSAR